MVIWLLEKVFLLTIAFAIYSKNVLKLGRNRKITEEYMQMSTWYVDITYLCN